MPRTTLSTLLLPFTLILSWAVSTAWADDTPVSIDAIHSVNKTRTEKAVQSQTRIDGLSELKNSLLDEYRATNKLIEGLKVYNQQLEIQASAQQRQLEEISSSITQATQMKRQITPLMLEMASALNQFVALDLPFHVEERQQRLSFINAALENPSVADSEKFRQVLEAYQIENEYGRKIDVYTDTIELDAQQINVNVLRVGRITLVAQTKDLSDAWLWSSKQQQWQVLDSDYRKPVRDAIRIARKQATPNMLMLPISAPRAQEVAGE